MLHWFWIHRFWRLIVVSFGTIWREIRSLLDMFETGYLRWVKLLLCLACSRWALIPSAINRLRNWTFGPAVKKYSKHKFFKLNPNHSFSADFWTIKKFFYLVHASTYWKWKNFLRTSILCSIYIRTRLAGLQCPSSKKPSSTPLSTAAPVYTISRKKSARIAIFLIAPLAVALHTRCALESRKPSKRKKAAEGRGRKVAARKIHVGMYVRDAGENARRISRARFA